MYMIGVYCTFTSENILKKKSYIKKLLDFIQFRSSRAWALSPERARSSKLDCEKRNDDCWLIVAEILQKSPILMISIQSGVETKVMKINEDFMQSASGSSSRRRKGTAADGWESWGCEWRTSKKRSNERWDGLQIQRMEEPERKQNIKDLIKRIEVE